MATVNGAGSWLAHGLHQKSWSALANGDVGSLLDAAQFGDRQVQVTGTFGAGGTLVIEGSNDGTNFHTLVDPQGTALSFTSAGTELILDNPTYMRPHVTGGDGTTALNVIITSRRNEA